MQYNDWQVDLSDSVKALHKIKDTILPKLISGNIICVEASSNDVLITIDQYSGIDYLRQNDIGLQGIAARVQFGFDYRTFTIRYSRSTGSETEYEKRKKQIENGYLYPAFTLQAYFDNRQDMNLLSICIIKTIDLYQQLETNKRVRTNKSDNVFKYLSWDDIDSRLIKMKHCGSKLF